MENQEIERKWRVRSLPEDLEGYETIRMEQAYLNVSPTVRIRKENSEFLLTYKGKGEGISHTEYNLPIDEEAFYHMLPKCDGRVIKKTRYVIPLEGGLKAELDIFDEPFKPLVIVEVEFPSVEAADAFKAPDWFGEDVSLDVRFKNAALAISEDFSPEDML